MFVANKQWATLQQVLRYNYTCLYLSAGALAAAAVAREGVLLVAGAVAAVAGLQGRPDIAHYVQGGPSRPPTGCGNAQDSDDDEARKQGRDKRGAAAAAAVKPFCMHDRQGKFDSQSKIQSERMAAGSPAAGRRPAAPATADQSMEQSARQQACNPGSEI
jgi:hypothetical protein